MKIPKIIIKAKRISYKISKSLRMKKLQTNKISKNKTKKTVSEARYKVLKCKQLLQV